MRIANFFFFFVIVADEKNRSMRITKEKLYVLYKEKKKTKNKRNTCGFDLFLLSMKILNPLEIITIGIVNVHSIVYKGFALEKKIRSFQSITKSCQLYLTLLLIISLEI